VEEVGVGDDPAVEVREEGGNWICRSEHLELDLRLIFGQAARVLQGSY
jgi:hypothetical protein